MTQTARRFSRADMRRLMSASGLHPLRVTGAFAFLVAPALVKAALERGRTASDLEEGAGTAGAVLARLASLERRWLARADLPFGLSILGLAVK